MKYDLEIESLLRVARAVRELERNATSADFNPTDHRLLLAETFQGRTLTFIELILDHEERAADFHAHWKRWRRAKRKQTNRTERRG